MPYKNKEKQKEYRRMYYQLHGEEVKKRARQWYQANKERATNHNKLWKKEHLEYDKLWAKEHPERMRESYKKHTHKRRRHLGFNPLNKWFEKSDAHHINFNDVIYIPKELHKSISHNIWTGKNMALINSVAYQFLTGNYIIYK